MDKDLKQFENRSDDWLAKERKHEEKVSAWDIDEGKKIKEYHEENCEAKEIKERHEKIHSGQIKPRQKNTSSLFVFILLTMVAIDIIPSLLANTDITLIPLTLIGMMVCAYAIIYLLSKRRQ